MIPACPDFSALRLTCRPGQVFHSFSQVKPKKYDMLLSRDCCIIEKPFIKQSLFCQIDNPY